MSKQHQQITTTNRPSNRPVAIVTGGTRGIGSGIATALARQGYDLLLTYNTNQETAKQFVEMIHDMFPDCKVECVGGDMTLVETRDRIFECYDTKFCGRSLQVLVHNAGQYVGVTSDNVEGLEADNLKFGDGSLISRRQKDDNNDDENGSGSEYTDLTTIKYYQRLYGDAWIDLCERCLQRMNNNDGDISGGGSIIGISSPGVNPCLYRPDRTYSGPGSGKTIMEYSMRIYAKVVAPRNINVNVVVPGLVQTPEWQSNTKYRKDSTESGQEMMDRLVDKLVPMKRLMNPIDIGNVVAFLCSPPGRFITGMTLPVDGGIHIN